MLLKKHIVYNIVYFITLLYAIKVKALLREIIYVLHHSVKDVQSVSVAKMLLWK